MEDLCTEAGRSSPRAPFSKLRSATFLLTSPIHLPLVKYPVYFAAGLEELQINQVTKSLIIHNILPQVYQPLEDSFMAALVSWSPFKHLK